MKQSKGLNPETSIQEMIPDTSGFPRGPGDPTKVLMPASLFPPELLEELRKPPTPEQKLAACEDYAETMTLILAQAIRLLFCQTTMTYEDIADELGMSIQFLNSIMEEVI